MKVKLTEQQINNLVNKDELSKMAPHLSKFIDLLKSFGPGSLSKNVTNLVPSQQQRDNQKTFAKNIPLKGNEMMHPLGRTRPISSEFGLRSSTVGGKNHKGIDISTPSGSPVYSPLDGIVEAARDTTPNPCGGFIQLNHNNIYTKFCHLRQITVTPGEKVKRGQLIGYSGGGRNDPMRGRTSGPHLHYEILNASRIAMNPISVQSNLAEDVKY